MPTAVLWQGAPVPANAACKGNTSSTRHRIKNREFSHRMGGLQHRHCSRRKTSQPTKEDLCAASVRAKPRQAALGSATVAQLGQKAFVLHIEPPLGPRLFQQVRPVLRGQG